MALSHHKAAARKSYMASLRMGAAPKQTAILPEPKAHFAQAVGWERSVPRCETCKHCQKEKTIVRKQTTSMPVLIVPPVCRRGKFYTKPGAVCDFWLGADGSTLEAA